MGFYGNITNTGNTTGFTFDKIYPNKKAMDDYTHLDGVVVGRHVLVEYGTEIYKQAYIVPNSTTENQEIKLSYKENDSPITFNSNLNWNETSTYNPQEVIISSDVGLNWIVYVIVSNEENQATTVYYKCTNHTGTVALFTKVDYEIKDAYARNFDIDTIATGTSIGRGYDSTVWTKQIIDGTEKYIQIAELNGVVPTFDLAIDAPTTVPQKPYFDTENTNVYYKLHMTPSLGIRVGQEEDATMSDGSTYWTREITDYDAEAEKIVSIQQYWDYQDKDWKFYSNSEDIPGFPAAIYFNSKGFTATGEGINTETTHSTRKNNYINMNLVSSQNKYDNDPSGNAKDTLEIEISLPAIGDAIADVYDIIYGKDRLGKSPTSLEAQRKIYQDLESGGITTVKETKYTDYGEEEKIYKQLITAKFTEKWDGDSQSNDFDIVPENLRGINNDPWITPVYSDKNENGEEQHKFGFYHEYRRAQDNEDGTNNDDTIEKINIQVYDSSNEVINEIEVNEANIDQAGHQIGIHKKTYILPYNYQIIGLSEIKKTWTQDKNGAPLLDDNNQMIWYEYEDYQSIPANNSEHGNEFTIRPDQKHIIGNILSNTDPYGRRGIQLSHANFTPIDGFIESTQAYKDYGPTANSYETFKIPQDGIIPIPNIQFDNAGHIVKAVNQNVELPNFNTIILKQQTNNSIEEPTYTPETIGSKALDTNTFLNFLNLETYNKWIKLTGSTNEFTDIDGIQKSNINIQFAHSWIDDQNIVGNTYGQYPIKDTENNELPYMINIPSFKIDEAGHIIELKNNTINLDKGIYDFLRIDGNDISDFFNKKDNKYLNIGHANKWVYWNIATDNNVTFDKEITYWNTTLEAWAKTTVSVTESFDMINVKHNTLSWLNEIQSAGDWENSEFLLRSYIKRIERDPEDYTTGHEFVHTLPLTNEEENITYKLEWGDKIFIPTLRIDGAGHVLSKPITMSPDLAAWQYSYESSVMQLPELLNSTLSSINEAQYINEANNMNFISNYNTLGGTLKFLEINNNKVHNNPLTQLHMIDYDLFTVENIQEYEVIERTMTLGQAFKWLEYNLSMKTAILQAQLDSAFQALSDRIEALENA